MDLKTIESFVEERLPGEDVGVELLMIQLGNIAEVMLNIKLDNFTEEEEQRAWAEVSSGLTMLAVEIALEHDIDITEAVSETIEEVSEEDEAEEELLTALEEGDYERVAELVFDEPEEEEDDGGDSRAFH